MFLYNEIRLRYLVVYVVPSKRIVNIAKQGLEIYIGETARSFLCRDYVRIKYIADDILAIWTKYSNY